MCAYVFSYVRQTKTLTYVYTQTHNILRRHKSTHHTHNNTNNIYIYSHNAHIPRTRDRPAIYTTVYVCVYEFRRQLKDVVLSSHDPNICLQLECLITSPLFRTNHRWTRQAYTRTHSRCKCVCVAAPRHSSYRRRSQNIRVYVANTPLTLWSTYQNQQPPVQYVQ